jgi:serine/threonine protein kinase
LLERSAVVRFTLCFMHGTPTVETSGSVIPRLHASEVTRPLRLVPRRRGPDLRDIVRLYEGEIRSLTFADRYRIGRRLGRGGMAVVFGGRNLDLDQPVAVKILLPREGDRERATARFLREARLGTRIRHENIVETFDYGETPEGLVYLVMELLEGEDLRALIARHEGLPWSRVQSLMLQICDGLAAVHAAGIVHQDLTPSNCFRVLADDGERIKLIDFGVATMVGDREEGSRMIVGTPQYMSPEQARGTAVDARSDVYSAGIILCELLTGHVPFHGTPVAVLTAQIEESPPSLQQLAPDGMRVDPALQRIYERAVAKDPAQRFAGIEELAAAIRAVSADEPVEVSGVFTPARAEPRGQSPATSSSVTVHSRSAIASSSPCRDGLATLQSAKYSPLTFRRDGCVAT